MHVHGDLEVRAEKVAPARARAWLEALRPCMTPARLDDLRLAVSELVANAVRHASPGADCWIRLTCRVTGTSTVVTIADDGPGFVFDPALGADGHDGRGLLVVWAIAERLAIDGSRRRVTVEIARD